MSQQFDLRKAFWNLQEQLRTKLDASAIITHPTEKGTHTELNWQAMLREFLPNRYGVEKAFAADVQGRATEQLDLVIYDCQYSPLLFKYDGGLYVPAESVYAVFEVKPQLNKENVEYAGGKIASVRELHRTSAPIWYAAGTHDPKPPAPILGGLLTNGSEWSPPFGNACDEAVLGADDKHRVDIGCALQHGGFEVIDDDEGPRVESWTEQEALVLFALRLFGRLQRMGTVPAIDVSEWADAASHQL